MLRALHVVPASAFELAFQNVVLVGNVEGCEHGQTQRINRRSLLGDGAHLAIHVFGEPRNVVGIGAAQVICLVKNLHPHTVGGGSCRSFFDGVLHGPLLSFGDPGNWSPTASSVKLSIWRSMFSTRPRISSRSRSRATTSRRNCSNSSSRASNCCRSR